MRLKPNTYIILENEDEYKKVIRMNIGRRWGTGELANKVIPTGSYPWVLILRNNTLQWCYGNQLGSLNSTHPQLTNIKDHEVTT